MGRHFSIRQVVAEDVKVAVVEVPVVFVVELAQGGGFVRFERRRGPLQHRFGFRRRSELSGTGRFGAQRQRQI